MSNSLDPDQAQHFVGPGVFKGYQQTLLVGKELTIFPGIQTRVKQFMIKIITKTYRSNK